MTDWSLTAVNPGTEGNAISMSLVDPAAASKSLAVVVDGNKITVNLATDENQQLTSTATEVKAALEASEAAALVTVAVLGDGSGDVASAVQAYLADGAAGTVPAG
ncbi:hypothetical protein P4S72_03355 [Vibrio sp. PP-XX7]